MATAMTERALAVFPSQAPPYGGASFPQRGSQEDVCSKRIYPFRLRRPRHPAFSMGIVTEGNPFGATSLRSSQ